MTVPIICARTAPALGWRRRPKLAGRWAPKATNGLVRMPLIDSFYGSGSPARPVTGPATTPTTRHRHALVEACGQRPAIDDCLYRMLQPHEIQRVMAFADDYRVLGSQRQKVRQLGNAVTPPVSQMLVERCVEGVFA